MSHGSCDCCNILWYLSLKSHTAHLFVNFLLYFLLTPIILLFVIDNKQWMDYKTLFYAIMFISSFIYNVEKILEVTYCENFTISLRQ